MQIRDI
jgi:hypothetical protein